MNLNPKYVVKLLEQNGFVFKRSKGSHQLYYNAETNKTVIVPIHGGKDMKMETFLAVLKQAGIDKNEFE
jgi:predicted RNA binding protein YcfA (HicA-like mRNA interferase family)